MAVKMLLRTRPRSENF